jgi:hypothetical protein
VYLLTALVLSSTLVGAQQMVNPPTRTITRAEVELAEPFSRLVGMREMNDGRLIVTDMTEKLIAVVDLDRKTSTRIGNEGSGPGEYTIPTAVMAMPGDTTYVSDMGRKYVKIGPDGKVAGDAPVAQNGGRGGAVFSFGPGAGNVDAMGRIYSRGLNFAAGPDGQTIASDSAPITRLDRRSGKTDTVAYVRMPRPQIQNSGGGANTRVTLSVGGNVPFVTTDAWAVAPDGRVALISPDPYRVTWVSPSGQRSVGQPISYQRVRVTESEKQAFRDAQKASPPTGVRVRVDGPGTASNVSTAPVAFSEPPSWPEYKHPYVGSGVFVAPNGELWIQKQLPHTEKNPTFDVIGSRGELTGRVVIPERTRLLGFGRDGAVYLVRRDADDLEYIGKYRLPAR